MVRHNNSLGPRRDDHEAVTYTPQEEDTERPLTLNVQRLATAVSPRKSDENLSQRPIIHRPHPYRVAKTSRISVAFTPESFGSGPLPCPESSDDRSGLGK